MRHVLLVAAVSLFTAAGCAHSGAAVPDDAGDGAQRPSAASSDLVAPEDAKVGDRTTCVVSGDEFVVEADTPRVEHEGRGYYVCCDGCVDDFRADPKKFQERAATREGQTR